MGKIESSHRIARFEGFELDLRAGELRREGERPVGLAVQPFRILVMLLEHPGNLVTREEIRDALWPNGTIVEFEHSISAAINRLRQLLGDSAEEPRYIETLARRGYRFRVRVEWMDGPREAGKVTKTAPDGSLIGKKVSHYRVLEVLGGGGMGVVYKAEDLKLGRRVALKFLPEELADDPAALHRFEREARAASALSHPNICTIHEIEEHEENPFIVMELLEGETLREVITRARPVKSPLELEKLLDVAIQISEGLDAAHRQGIIHRDIKPANIFITSQGQAKILDFGLAKLSPGATADRSNSGGQYDDGDSHSTSRGAAANAPAELYLSRTGATMGTAGYMSPEQVRGEKLDARTDLFSFGLVLYEMATGKRVFSGDTAPELHDAILTQTPAPARQLNPELPAKLEKIIEKALEKDREARYQAASELRADLKSLGGEREARPGAQRWTLVAAAAAALLIAGPITWFARVRQPSTKAPLEPKLRQLTTNSFENRVTSGKISPDGKYLAYSDTKGMYVKLIETGEIRAVPPPPELKDQNVVWNCAFWLQDGTGFIANATLARAGLARGDSHGSSIWTASALGGAPRKLRDNAFAFSISRDGSWISFTTNRGKRGDREIWLMAASGDQARKLFDTDEESAIFGLQWSPDGKRVLYVKTEASGDTLLSGDLHGGPPATLLGPHEMKQVSDFLWLADGRLLYSVAEPDSFAGSACNFWVMQLDGRTGTSVGKPRRLANWPGFCESLMSETSDGKKVAFLRSADHMTSYLADLADGGTHILTPRHFPLSESSEGVVSWTLDSKTVILVSNPSGNFGIYKQALDADTAEPLVTQGYGRDAHITPDGRSVVYLGIGENGAWPARGPEPVMRVSITGGPVQQLFTARPYSLIRCSRSRSNLCVIAEPSDDGTQLIVSAMDVTQGRGPELFRFGLVANDDNWWLDLSPDGTRTAVTQTVAGPIYILSLSGQVLQQVKLKGWSNLWSVAWAADGKGLYVTSGVRGGREVLHVDLQGNVHVLWENTGASNETFAAPSPDGRRLALNGWTTSGNMWVMESF